MALVNHPANCNHSIDAIVVAYTRAIVKCFYCKDAVTEALLTVLLEYSTQLPSAPSAPGLPFVQQSKLIFLL